MLGRSMRLKLLTPWFGELPPWYSLFEERIEASPAIDHALARLPSLEYANAYASQVLGSPCRKGSEYAFGCDLRPLAWRLFLDDADWWGWCDLDVVLGDLDRLLLPLLDYHDVVTADPYSIAGSFTLLRNAPEVHEVCRIPEEVLITPDYCNYDEVGFAPEDWVVAGRWNGNPSLSRVVKESSLRVHYASNVWTEGYRPLDSGAPSRCCELHDGRLLEVPTGRELLLYHFTSKRWPLPNRYGAELLLQKERLKEPEPTPSVFEESPAYWASQLAKAQEDNSWLFGIRAEDLALVLRRTETMLRQYPGDRILDAGCGVGGLLTSLYSAGLSGIQYTGVDYCPEMVQFARRAWRRHRFEVADIRDLPFPDGCFDVAFCRGVEGSVRTLLSNQDWRRMEMEMKRVAKVVVVMNQRGEYRCV